MLEGVYVANVTPFRDDHTRSVDVDAYVSHVRWLADAGVRGVVPFGTNGEGPSVAAREKRAVLAELVAAELPIQLVPTVAEGNLPDTLDQLAFLDDLDVAAVLVLPPYYFKPVEVTGMRDFYVRVLAATRHAVVGYHIPKYAVPLPLEVVTTLPLWGVKDSGGEPGYADAVRASGRGVLLGTEDDLPRRLPLAKGAISALANVVPEQVVALHRAVRAGDGATAARLSTHLQVVRAMTKTYAAPGVLKRVAQARHGHPMGTVRPPLVPVPVDFDAAGAAERAVAVG